mmetsp:Transcript_43097/g.115214  ORF Transcript_43097/g.115214 Transcript_43097/m.115214 type:complete len:286 (+) Transcript_43097:256-1113(+)
MRSFVLRINANHQCKICRQLEHSSLVAVQRLCYITLTLHPMYFWIIRHRQFLLIGGMWFALQMTFHPLCMREPVAQFPLMLAGQKQLLLCPLGDRRAQILKCLSGVHQDLYQVTVVCLLQSPRLRPSTILISGHQHTSDWSNRTNAVFLQSLISFQSHRLDGLLFLYIKPTNSHVRRQRIPRIRRAMSRFPLANARGQLLLPLPTAVAQVVARWLCHKTHGASRFRPSTKVMMWIATLIHVARAACGGAAPVHNNPMEETPFRLHCPVFRVLTVLLFPMSVIRSI